MVFSPIGDGNRDHCLIAVEVLVYLRWRINMKLLCRL